MWSWLLHIWQFLWRRFGRFLGGLARPENALLSPLRKPHVWIFFHRDLVPEEPEAAEIFRFSDTANRMNVALDVLKPQDFDLIVDTNRGWSAVYKGRVLDKPDVILARTGSETSYFMLAVLRHFERQGVGMLNGADVVEAVADKLHSLQILSSHGIPTPRTILGKFPVDVDLVERELDFPVVVKTLKGTRGTGVLLCSDRAQFGDLATLLDGAKPGADFIFQQYIRESHGHDIRVLVIDGKAVAAMERRSVNGGFKANVSQGGHASQFILTGDIAQLAEAAARALKLDIAGVDILFDEKGYRVCEVNSSPGFQGLEAACGVDVPALVFQAIFDGHKRLP